MFKFVAIATLLSANLILVQCVDPVTELNNLLASAHPERLQNDQEVEDLRLMLGASSSDVRMNTIIKPLSRLVKLKNPGEYCSEQNLDNLQSVIGSVLSYNGNSFDGPLVDKPFSFMLRSYTKTVFWTCLGTYEQRFTNIYSKKQTLGVRYWQLKSLSSLYSCDQQDMNSLGEFNCAMKTADDMKNLRVKVKDLFDDRTTKHMVKLSGLVDKVESATLRAQQVLLEECKSFLNDEAQEILRKLYILAKALLKVDPSSAFIQQHMFGWLSIGETCKWLDEELLKVFFPTLSRQRSAE